MNAKYLTDLDWTKLATSHDTARPIFGAVHVNGHMESTDGYRAHMANSTGYLEPGIYDTFNMARIPDGEVRYPNIEAITPAAEPNLKIEDLERFGAIVAAAQAATRAGLLSYVSLPSAEGSVLLNPAYLLDVLKGATGPQKTKAEVTIMTAGPLKPVKVVIAGLGRTAVLMPVRRPQGKGAPEGSPDPRFDLAEFCQPAVAEALAA